MCNLRSCKQNTVKLLINDSDEVMNTCTNSQNTAGNLNMTRSNFAKVGSGHATSNKCKNIGPAEKKIGQRLDKIEGKDFERTAKKSKIES